MPLTTGEATLFRAMPDWQVLARLATIGQGVQSDARLRVDRFRSGRSTCR
jgi:hypothetical protein